MFFAAALLAGLFISDNAEFFKTVQQNKEDGLTWNYVGKKTPDGSPAITIKNSATGEESIYWKMK